MPPGTEILRSKLGKNISVWAPKRFLDHLIKSGIANPAEFIANHANSIIDNVTRSKITSLSLYINGRIIKIAAKEYLPRSLRKSLKNIFRPSKARRELVSCAKLHNLGIPAPEPIAAIEMRSFRFLKKSFLFSEELTGVRSLLDLLDSKEHMKLKRGQLNRISSEIASVLARAHSKGFIHGDLNASHVLLRDWERKRPNVFFIDFENSRFLPRVGVREIGRDLSRLEKSAKYFLSAKERIRFLRYYCKSNENDFKLNKIAGIVRDEVGRRTR